jgi:hypothetical protein
MSMKKSVEFEQLVAKIVAELEPTAVVTWNDHIDGKRSGLKRQIDVSIRRAGPDFLGIVDAKDYTRPATVERIDNLVGVMQDIEANYGALVCSSGFAKTIYTYAKNCGISLFNIHDAQSINWSLELMIPILWTDLKPFTTLTGMASFHAGDSVVTDDPRGLQVTVDGGKTIINPLSTFEGLWNSRSLNWAPGQIHHLRSERPVEALVMDTSGQRQLRPVQDYGISYWVESTVWLGRFQPEDCRGLIDYLNDQAFTVTHLPDS